MFTNSNGRGDVCGVGISSEVDYWNEMRLVEGGGRIAIRTFLGLVRVGCPTA